MKNLRRQVQCTGLKKLHKAHKFSTLVHAERRTASQLLFTAHGLHARNGMLGGYLSQGRGCL